MITVVALLTLLVYATANILYGKEETVVLNSGFPLILPREDTYPNILGSDVSEMISADLLQDVATR